MAKAKHPKQMPLSFFRNCKTFIYFTLALFLSSCVAKFPVSTIYAEDDVTKAPVQWPEVKDESEAQLVKVRPLENIDEMLLFELEVTNKTDQPLPITPQDWQLEYLASPRSLDSLSADTVSYPLSGARVNQGYQKVAKEIKAAKDGTTAIVVIGVILIVALIIIIASDGDSGSGGNVASNSYDHYLATGLDLSFVFFNRPYAPPNTESWSEKDKITYFRERGKELEKVYHGPQTIPPGETYFFGLFYPRKKEARHLSLKGVIGNERYEYDFQHDGLNLPEAEM